MHELIGDFRYAVRVLQKSPLTTVVAVFALALGIGVNASSFITINSLILHPLPYPHLERIMTLWGTPPKVDTQRTPLSPADFADIQRQATSFEAVGAVRPWDASLTVVGNPERLQAAKVSPAFFTVLGTSAHLGRTFAADEDEPSRAKLAVISDGLWKSHFAGSRDIVGKQITLNKEKYTIVGVMPDELDFPLQTELWAPLPVDPIERHNRASHDLIVLGLLKKDVRLEQARAEVAAIGSRLARQYPATNEDRGVKVVPMRQLTEEVTNHFVMTLLGAALFVLLLACANVGNLQLARAANRQKDIAIRAALGANRFHAARQLLAESVLISLAAGVVGLLLAAWNNDLMQSSIPATALKVVPGLRHLRMDGAVIAMTIATALVTGLICSVPSFLHLVYGRMDGGYNELLRGRSDAGSRAPSRSGLRTTLIVSELALALVLLVGAGLMVKTFHRMTDLNQGFDPRNLLTMSLTLPKSGYPDATAMIAFYDRMLRQAGTLHNVPATAVESRLGGADHFAIQGRPEPRAGEPRPQITAVSSQYLEAMHIPLIEGRAIAESDRSSAPKVVVISKDVAQHYWPGSSPIGQHIRLDARGDYLTVVGVVGNVIEDWFRATPTPFAYVSYAQFPGSTANILARTTGAPELAAPGLRASIRSVDADLPVYDVKSMEEVQYESRGGVRAAARSMTTYAVIALLLAVTGIYAVISYSVASRTHDIGVHMALGASRADVLSMIMRQAGRLTLIGLAFGLPMAFGLAQLMSSVLYNTVNLEPITFAMFAGVLVVATMLASYFPSRRAMRIEPITALRTE